MGSCTASLAVSIAAPPHILTKKKRESLQLDKNLGANGIKYKKSKAVKSFSFSKSFVLFFSFFFSSFGIWGNCFLFDFRVSLITFTAHTQYKKK